MESIQKRFTKEQYREYLAGILKGFDQMNKAFSTLAQTAREWDGKVYNKRFADAVEERTKPAVYFSLGERASWNGLFEGCRLSLRDRSVNVSARHFGQASHDTIYFDSEIQNRVYFTYSSKYGNDILVRDDKGNERINGAAFAAACDEAIQENNRRAAKFRAALKEWDKSLATLEKIDAFLNKCANTIHPFFVDLDGARMRLYSELMKPAYKRYE